VPTPYLRADRIDGKALDKFPVWTEVDWDSAHKKPRSPPLFVKLSDERVYLMTKFLKTKTRGVLWRMDFTQNGDVRQ
jgi:hypothetical protein